ARALCSAMRRRRLRSLVLAAALHGAGCAATSWPIDPGDPVTLRADEGLLVVHVHTNRPLRSIDIGGVQAAENLPEGTEVRLIGISAGRYRWAESQLQNVPGGTYYDTFRFRDVEPFRFHVQPGVINYVGMVDIERSDALSVTMNSLDRTAIALEQLRKSYPDLLARYPVVYSGPARHVFLDRYRSSVAHPNDAVRAVQSAHSDRTTEALFRPPALLWAALNPSGTLCLMQGYNGGTQVVTVRNTSNGASTTVFSYSGPIAVV